MNSLQIFVPQTSTVILGATEAQIAYDHYDPALIKAETGRHAPVYLVNIFCDASGSLRPYEAAIRQFLKRLPNELKREMKEEGNLPESFQERILVGIASFTNTGVSSNEKMRNAKQLLPFMPLSLLVETDWADNYRASGITPLVDAAYLSAEISANYAEKLAENGVQTYGINVILTDGGDTDYDPFSMGKPIISANFYADIKIAKESLELVTTPDTFFKSAQTLVIGIGKQEEAINYVTKQLGINAWLYAGDLSEERMDSVFKYLAKLFVFQAKIALLTQGQLCLPPASVGSNLGIQLYEE